MLAELVQTLRDRIDDLDDRLGATDRHRDGRERSPKGL
jgi:hypothetical protein